jgi:hypothetical protein
VVESAPTRLVARGRGVVLPTVERWQRESDSRKLLWSKMGPMLPRMGGDLAVNPVEVVVRGVVVAVRRLDEARPVVGTTVNSKRHRMQRHPCPLSVLLSRSVLSGQQSP